jgi:hypothetical protein
VGRLGDQELCRFKSATTVNIRTLILALSQSRGAAS